MTTGFVSSSAGRRFRGNSRSSHPTAPHATRSRGSAILVAVVLLVLLAIMGVAFISSTRSERLVSASATHAVQGDLLVRAALGLVESALVNDVIDYEGGRRRLRPAAADGETDVRYDHFDAATGTGADDFLAERFPTRAAAGDPVLWPAISGPVSTATAFEDPTRMWGAHSFADREDLEPTTITYGGKQWPALQAGTGPGARRYLAADTDGDGIADAALAPLGVRHNGVTYYAAVRMVDNNAAINASVAWRRHDDPTKRTPGTSFFPTHVDLEPVLARGEEDNLSAYRFGDLSSGDRKKLDPAAAWMDYARFVHRESASGGGGASAFRMLPASDALALAQDPLGLTSHGGPLLQTLLPATLRARPIRLYAPRDVQRWYEENYDFTSDAVSRRPLLVASNPLSNVVPTRDVPPHLAQLFGVPERVSAAPANVNAASFELLWYSYWNMMSGDGSRTPFEVAAAIEADKEEKSGTAAVPTLIANRMFRSPIRAAQDESVVTKPPVIAAAAPSAPPASPPSDVVSLPPFEVVLLRAALAAVNTIDLRDADHEVTSRRITLKGRKHGAEEGLSVTVFGNEPQPFITEVYVHTNTLDNGGPGGQRNPRGYVAVELHNPFDAPLSLKGWRLAVAGRGAPSQAASGVFLRGMTDMEGFDETVVVPAKGYLVIENYSADGTSTAAYRPVSSGLPGTGAANVAGVATAYVRNLHEVLEDGGSPGGELVLLRPCKATGNANTSGAQASGAGNAGTINLDDYAPIDQYDFTGIELQNAGEAKYHIWQYSRLNGPGAHAWKFVYPGKYDAAQSVARQAGTRQTQVETIDGEPTVALANLGRPDNDAGYAHPFPGIALAQQPSPTDAYPYGQFARVADALAVPFVGAYSVRDDDGTLLEMNAITMDTAYADDQDPATDAHEHLGRLVLIPPLAGASVGGPKVPRDRIHWRPDRSVGHGAEVRYENFYIANIVDKDAVQIQGYDDRAKSGNWYAPGRIILRNFEVGYTERSPAGKARALHVDHVQITLGRQYQEITTDVTIEDGYIHSGNADTLLIQDGKYGTIHIRNLKVGPGLAAVKLTIEKGGSIERIIIEDCPGLRVAVTGVKGKEAAGGNIGYVEVINSPGAQVKPQRNWETGASLKLDIRHTNTGTPREAGGVDDFGDNPALWRYGWARDFFEHFTTLPTAADSFETDGRLKVQTEPATPAPVEGLVNINTAPWPVLAALPLLEQPSSTDRRVQEEWRYQTRQIAKAIVAGRAANAYPTLRHLTTVVEPYLRLASVKLRSPMPTPDEPVDLEKWRRSQGDLSPEHGQSGEFAHAELLLERIGNLVTTRSDSFTCHLTIQGWRNANQQGGEPELVLERREVYVLDRSEVTPEKPRVKIMSSQIH